jgi:hypothetical protein
LLAGSVVKKEIKKEIFQRKLDIFGGRSYFLVSSCHTLPSLPSSSLLNKGVEKNNFE